MKNLQQEAVLAFAVMLSVLCVLMMMNSLSELLNP